MDRHEFFGWVFIGAAAVLLFLPEDHVADVWGSLILGNLYLFNSESAKRRKASAQIVSTHPANA